jgi:hypothetical protein
MTERNRWMLMGAWAMMICCGKRIIIARDSQASIG